MYASYVPRNLTKWHGRLCKMVSQRPCSSVCSSQLSSRPQCHWPATILCSHGQRSAPNTPFATTRRFGRGYTTQSLKEFASKSPALLRDMCQCTQCVDPSTRQREFNYADIPTNISVKEVEQDPDSSNWKVKWNNDIPGYANHVSEYSHSTLTQVLHGVPAGLDVPRILSVWDGKTFEQETRDIDYNELLESEQTLAAALELFQRHGLIFVTAVPEDEEAVRQMLKRLTGLYRNTFYGENWNVRSVPQAKNVAYTSKILGFHMDLLYMKEPPGVQLLHCLQNSCQGGESEFADTFKAVDILRQEHPDYVERLANSKIRYGYSNDGQFYSDDKPVIKVGNEKHRPAAKIAGVADTDFMQNVECTFWSPPFVNSIAPAAHDGNIKEFIDASKAFAEVLQRPELIFETKLPAGTCAIFDNLRVVHARKAFDMNSGSRWLKGMYGDRQDLLSKTLKHAWNKGTEQEVKQ